MILRLINQFYAFIVFIRNEILNQIKDKLDNKKEDGGIKI